MRRRFLPPTKSRRPSVGDVNSVDPTGGVIPAWTIYMGLIRRWPGNSAHLQLAHQNMTTRQRYAWSDTPWRPNQTTTDASPRLNFQQPTPQTRKVPDPGRPTIKPGAGGEFGIELGLVGAAFQQLGHMQRKCASLGSDGKQFDRDAVKNEIMKKLPDADRSASACHRSQPAASNAGRQQSAGMNPTKSAATSSTVCLRA
jgi:hypothetical protein